MKVFFENDWCQLFHGDSSQFVGECDVVLTNPYAPLPKFLQEKPMFIIDFNFRHSKAEERCGTKLFHLSSWFEGKNVIWYGNIDDVGQLHDVDFSHMMPEPEGWFPYELPKTILQNFCQPGMTVWDGFMGRGTVGRACKDLGLNFIGVDKQMDRVEKAYDYIFQQ